MTLPPPKKRLGQHFLTDHNIVRKIVAAARLGPADTALEIGPGRGILTRALCEQAGKVIAVEVDRSLEDTLRVALADTGNLDLLFGDALDFVYATLPKGTVVVANLPYVITTPLLFKLLEAHERIDRMVLMVQTEVAKRFVAKPGTKDYGILSVLTQYRAEPALAFSVSAGCFRPKPAVNSTVVTMAMRRAPAAAVENEAVFIRTVRAAFAHRRKTLANSLRDEGLLSEQIAQALAQAGIAPTVRAETLELKAFAALANELARGRGAMG
ncbi:MAG: ribosomal RNA small subunit methyltransferase A [Nitrospira sp.]|nr:ribosomal RNA small subunit methyltransferase A [Nitrospira sp.]